MATSTAVSYDGIRFASKAEAGFYIHLKAQEEKGNLSEIVTQPSWDLYACGHDNIFDFRPQMKIGKYTADFTYLDHFLEQQVVVDIKGQIPHTKPNGKRVSGGQGWTAFRLRCKILKANYDIDVEVVAGKEYTELYNKTVGVSIARKTTYARRKRKRI